MEINKIQLLNTTYTIIDSNLRQQLANAYNESTTYVSGDFCIYNNGLYQCTEDTQGVWDSNCWESKKITDIDAGGETIYYVEDSGIPDDEFMDVFNKTITEAVGDYEFVNPAAFATCSSLQYAIFPNCSSIGAGAFKDCTSLSYVYTPNCITIGNNAFQNCSSLQNIDLPNCSIIGGLTFAGCSSLQTINAPNCTFIGGIGIGLGQTFYGCNSLQYISFPNCSDVAHTTFNGCNNVSYIYLPKCKKAGAQAFAYCRNVSYIYLPELSDVDSFYLFAGCTSLQSINIEKILTIGWGAFESCTSLQSLNIPVCSSIETYAFSGCTSLQSLYLLSTSVCTLTNSNAFLSTPMQYSSYTGTWGSIYVPSSLVATYKNATNWTYYSSRITAYTG